MEIHEAYPYLRVHDTAEAVDFYARAFGAGGPRSLGGTTFSIHLHVDDVDRAFERAVASGATVVRPLQDQFYGERSGTVRDPFGHEWLIGGRIESVTPEEMQRRYTAMFNE
jgi:uncharacterized glyoxalase superfamily protein PhnB